MKALVVDDSRMMRAVEQRALEAIGWQVASAANGVEALAALRGAETYDLVLADWQMPEMNGIELVKRIRQDPRFAKLRVIMVSSNAMMETIQEALDAGANDFVMKPFTVESLQERVSEAIHG